MKLKKFKLLFLLGIVKNTCNKKIIISGVILSTFIIVIIKYKDKKKSINLNLDTNKEKNNNKTWTIEDEEKLILYKLNLMKNLYTFFKDNNLLKFTESLSTPNKDTELIEFCPNNKVFFNKNSINQKDINLIIEKIKNMKNEAIKIYPSIINKSIEASFKKEFYHSTVLFNNINLLITRWEGAKII